MPTIKCVPCNNRVFKDDKAYQQHARSNAAHKARMEASAPKPSTSLAGGSVSTHRNQGKSHRRPNHGANFTSPSKHESHSTETRTNSVVTVKVPCYCLPERWLHRDKLQEHYNQSSNHPKCSRCNQGFLTFDHLVMHKSSHIPCTPIATDIPSRGTAGSPGPRPICTQCKIQFQDTVTYEKHRGREHTYPCSECNLGFPILRLREEHQIKEHPIRCTLCTKVFPSTRIFKQHAKNDHHIYID